MWCAAVSEEFRKAIDAYINEHKVLAFIKGSADFPQCGFSNTVVMILKRMEVPFETVDILSNEMLRSGMKEYSQVWHSLQVPDDFIIVSVAYRSSFMRLFASHLHACSGIPITWFIDTLMLSFAVAHLSTGLH